MENTATSSHAPQAAIPLNNKKIINGWAIFDWANSAYALVITAAIFPAYFAGVTDEVIRLGSLEIYSSTFYAYSITIAYLIIAALSPLLSGIADYGGRKMFFMRLFTTMGSIACIALFFFKDMSTLAIGTIGFIIATIGFSGSLVFYNSYLPEIATEDKYDSVSAKGFALGYIGSILLLLTNLAIIQKPDWFGIDPENATLPARISFVMVGLWWFGFSQITFNRLPKDPVGKPQSNLFQKGLGEIKKVWQQIKPERNIKRFLMAFFCYSAGAQTVIFLAATFAEKELGFETSQLIMTILLLQIVGIAGAYLFAKISSWRGNIFSLSCILIIWISICVLAFFVGTQNQFYLTAAMVGLVMGGVQSLSRSTYSKLIPENEPDTTSYFSFYDVLEKVSIVSGTFLFGFVEQITGNLRNSVLSLAVFFIIGFVLLVSVKIRGQQKG